MTICSGIIGSPTTSGRIHIEMRLYARQSSPSNIRRRFTDDSLLDVVAGVVVNICMSTRRTRMSPCRGSAGNVRRPVPVNRHAAGCVMSSSTRLASTGFLSQPNSAEFSYSIGIKARGDWPDATLGAGSASMHSADAMKIQRGMACVLSAEPRNCGNCDSRQDEQDGQDEEDPPLGARLHAQAAQGTLRGTALADGGVPGGRSLSSLGRWGAER